MRGRRRDASLVATVGGQRVFPEGGKACALFAWLISHQPAVLFSQNKSATNNQPTVLFSQNKSALAISHQPTEQAAAPPAAGPGGRHSRRGPPGLGGAPTTAVARGGGSVRRGPGVDGVSDTPGCLLPSDGTCVTETQNSWLEPAHKLLASQMR
jgi:hypothetical protein